MTRQFNLSCPVPLDLHSSVQLAHGGGGRLMRGLIERMFLPAFRGEGAREEGSGFGVHGSAADAAVSRTHARAPSPQFPAPSPPHDSAVVETGGVRLAFTTDTFVVSPLFFPGGDIGKLAVCGTVNDLAMAGATPMWLSAAFILEEGLPLETLGRIVASMQETAEAAGVRIVTGDTKVVDRGKGDGVFINTAGIGLVPPGIDVSPARVAEGDAILVSGDLGRHGIAVMSVREGLKFEGALESDCAPLAELVAALTTLGADLHCLRDLTRGGLASALNEIALDAKVGMELEEADIPVAGPVAGACELLGLDPLYTANEGRLVAFVSEGAAEQALKILRDHSPTGPGGYTPALIGRVTGRHPGVVELRSPIGGRRILDLLSGEQMPRIC